MAAKCNCPQNYTGDFCQILTEETCARDPCQALDVNLSHETFSPKKSKFDYRTINRT